MLLLTIAMWLTRDPIQRAAYVRQRSLIQHRRHSRHFGFGHRLTILSVHSGHHRRSSSVGTSGNYTKTGNPRTGNRRGPRKGY